MFINNQLNQLSKFSTATICEALGNKGNLPSGIKPIAANMKICGPAYTVQTMPRDNVLLHRAYAYAKAGDVLIANCSGFYEAGYWGDLMSLGAKTKGINGLVIDACVRDADDIEAMGFPVFSRGLCIRGTSNHGDGTLTVTGKGSKQRMLPLGEFAAGAIDAYLVRGRGTLAVKGRARVRAELGASAVLAGLLSFAAYALVLAALRLASAASVATTNASPPLSPAGCST